MSPNPSAEQLAERVAEDLAEIVNTAKALLDPLPGRIIAVAPGESVAWDDCCDGQLWTRLISFSPHDGNSPAQRSGMDVCALPWFIATVELGIIRCAAVLNDQGVAPTPLQIVADGVQGLNDMAQLMAAIKCADVDIRGLGSWTPQGPEGGCFGGYWTFTLRYSNCLVCPPPPPEPEPEPDPDPTPEVP